VVAVLAMSCLASPRRGCGPSIGSPPEGQGEVRLRAGRKWLEHVRLASVRTKEMLGRFVVASGLLITNHHCASDCAEDLSTSVAIW
jgi:hypothetical protein